MTLIILALGGLLATRWGAAQSTNPASAKKTKTYDFGALEQMGSFCSYLQETKQTNALERFNVYAGASTASQQYADLGLTLAILERLRSGRTNEAYELLEGQLNSEVIGFVACYRELPRALQEQGSLKVLKAARDYRGKHPFKHRYREVDAGVVEAFRILDEKGD